MLSRELRWWQKLRCFSCRWKKLCAVLCYREQQQSSSRSKGLLEPNWLHIVSAKGTRPDPTEATCFSTSRVGKSRIKRKSKRERKRGGPLSSFQIIFLFCTSMVCVLHAFIVYTSRPYMQVCGIDEVNGTDFVFPLPLSFSVCVFLHPLFYSACHGVCVLCSIYARRAIGPTVLLVNGRIWGGIQCIPLFRLAGSSGHIIHISYIKGNQQQRCTALSLTCRGPGLLLIAPPVVRRWPRLSALCHGLPIASSFSLRSIHVYNRACIQRHQHTFKECSVLTILFNMRVFGRRALEWLIKQARNHFTHVNHHQRHRYRSRCAWEYWNFRAT